MLFKIFIVNINFQEWIRAWLLPLKDLILKSGAGQIKLSYSLIKSGPFVEMLSADTRHAGWRSVGDAQSGQLHCVTCDGMRIILVYCTTPSEGFERVSCKILQGNASSKEDATDSPCLLV